MIVVQHMGQSLINGVLMSQDDKKFPEISTEIKILVRDGLYSFYQLMEGPDSGNYLLITDDRRYYLLSDIGRVIKELDSTPKHKLRKASLTTSSNSFPARKLNYA